ncbi:MAG: tetratricopeptide repeat protein [Thermoleophilia bacterium]|nr:tetratricopeptide repeat protein [Thermoleophilia bacterium]
MPAVTVCSMNARTTDGEHESRDEALLGFDLAALADDEHARRASDAGRVSLLGRISDRCLTLGLNEAAVLHAQRAVDAVREIRQPTLMPQALMRLATSLRVAGRHQEAIDLLMQVTALADRPGSDRYLHWALQHMGWSYTEVGDHARARECLESALGIRERMGDDELVSSTRRALTKVAGSGSYPDTTTRER